MYVLGIDGGGTKTHAVILDEQGRVVGQGTAGPSNFFTAGLQSVQKTVLRSANAAMIDAGIPDMTFNAVFGGFAGCLTEGDKEELREGLRNLRLSPNVDAHHDCYIALAGATGGRPGVVLISGTGSSCFGRNEAGNELLVGGWGHLLGDDGSAFDIGRMALRAVIKASEGMGPPTALTEIVCRRFKLSNLRHMLHRLPLDEHVRIREIASIAPFVVRAAEEGDPAAGAIWEAAVHILTDQVKAVVRALQMEGAFHVGLIGGVLSRGSSLTGAVRSSIQRALPDAVVIHPMYPPGVGAALLALAMCGVDPTNVQVEPTADAASRCNVDVMIGDVS